MTEGDVECFDAGMDDMLVVGFRSRRHEITVRDIGPGMPATPQLIAGHYEERIAR